MIHEADEFASGADACHAGIPRRGRAGVGLLDQPDAIILSGHIADNLRRAIGAAVIHDDAFPIADGLLADARQRMSDEFLGIVRRDHYADAGSLCHDATTPRAAAAGDTDFPT